MNARASLVGGNPTLFTVFRRLVAHHIAVIAIAASVLLGLAFEWEIIPLRALFYGALLLFIFLAVLAQVTVMKRGRIIDGVAIVFAARGEPEFVRHFAKVFVRECLAHPKFISALDVIYPKLHSIAKRIGCRLPENYAELMREVQIAEPQAA